MATASSPASSHTAAAPPVLWSRIQNSQVDRKNEDEHERESRSDLEPFEFCQPCEWFVSAEGCRQAERCIDEHVSGGQAIRADLRPRATKGAQSSADSSAASQPKANAQSSKTAQRKGTPSLSHRLQAARLATRSFAFSNDCYLADTLQLNDAIVRSETGVLPFRQSDSCTFQVLFGEEINADGTAQLCLISGPRTQQAGGSSHNVPPKERFPWPGALDLLGGHAMARLASEDGQCPVLWLPSAKLALHLLELCGELELSIQERFNLILGRPAAAPANEEPWRHYRQLHWVELKELMDCVHSNDRTAPLTTAGGVSVPLAAASMHALRQPPLLDQLELMQRDAERTAVLTLLEAAPATGVAESVATVSAASPAEQQQSQHISRHCYVAPSLQMPDSGSFKSAAVIAYRRNGGRIEVLFRRSRNPAELSPVGGLRIQSASPAHTAAHLFWQAKASSLAVQSGIQSELELRQRFQCGPVMWEPTIRTALFFLQLADTEQSANAAAVAEATTQLCWIELATLLRFLDKGFQRRRTVAQECIDEVRTTSGGASSMSSPAVCILRRPPLLAALDRLLRDSSPPDFEDICAGRAARARVMAALYGDGQRAADQGPAPALVPHTEEPPPLTQPHHSSPPSALPPISQHAYLAKKLRPIDAAGVRSVGVLAYRRTAGDVEVLMGRYGDSVGARKAGRLNLFGGKIGADESAAATATRLMWEECGRLFDRQSLLQRVERSDVVWLPGSRYALHLVELVSDSELAICELYAAAPSAVRADSVHASHPLQGQYAGRERRAMIDDSAVRSPRVQDLHWIELPTLLRFLATQPRLMSKAGCNDLLTTATGLQCPVVDFAVCTMNAVKVQKRLTQLQQQQPQQQQQQHGTAAHSPSVQHAVIDASPMGVAGVTHSRPDGAAAAPHDHSSNASSRGRRRRTHQQSHADVAPAAAPSSSSSTSTAFAPADVDDEWARARARAQAARAQRLARV